jgi:hypothetical protein
VSRVGELWEARRQGRCMARHAMGDRRDETLKQGHEEYLLLLGGGKACFDFCRLRLIFPLALRLCACVCARPVKVAGVHGTLNQGRDQR